MYKLSFNLFLTHQLVSKRFGFIQLVPKRFGSIQLVPKSFGFIQVVPKSFGFIQLVPKSWFHLASPKEFWFHLAGPKEFCFHLTSPKEFRFHLAGPKEFCFHLAGPKEFYFHLAGPKEVWFHLSRFQCTVDGHNYFTRWPPSHDLWNICDREKQEICSQDLFYIPVIFSISLCDLLLQLHFEFSLKLSYTSSEYKLEQSNPYLFHLPHKNLFIQNVIFRILQFDFNCSPHIFNYV